jgi:preprotein translocase subunit SecF
MKDHPFTKHVTALLIVPAVIVLVGIVLTLFGRGMSLGIDFVGGTQIRYDLHEDYSVDDIQAILAEMSITESQIAKTGDAEPQTEVLIRIKLESDSEQTRTALEAALKDKYASSEPINVERVGASAGQDLVNNAVYSLLIAFACMLIYIGIRFDLYSGVSALFGLLHDCLVMCAFMVFFSGLYQINSSFIAAILTIVGYSINNTIIVFDRIREMDKLSKYAGKSKLEVVEDSVRYTLSRTINTTLTTLLTLVTLHIMGVDSIKEFTFPLIIGLLAGNYSAMFLSGQIWEKWSDARAIAKRLKAHPKKA